MEHSNFMNREYYCPLCAGVEQHRTNHTGEIYCFCKKCGNWPLYCSEVNQFDSRPYISARIHFYAFNLENKGDRTAYVELVQAMKLLNYEKFNCLEHKTYQVWQALKQHDGRTVKLYDPEQFVYNYVSDLGRVFPWKEAIYPNKKIKDGYYLEILK